MPAATTADKPLPESSGGVVSLCTLSPILRGGRCKEVGPNWSMDMLLLLPPAERTETRPVEAAGTCWEARRTESDVAADELEEGGPWRSAAEVDGAAAGGGGAAGVADRTGAARTVPAGTGAAGCDGGDCATTRRVSQGSSALFCLAVAAGAC